MALTDVRNFVIEQIKGLDPNIDTREGSAIRDLLIEPLAVVLNQYQADHDTILNRTALKDLTQLSDDELEAVGANFLVDRSLGGKSTGNIKCFFNTPRPFSVVAGTILTSDAGLDYQISSNYSITQYAMENNVDDYPNYSTTDIAVIATVEGEEYNAVAGTSYTFKTAIQATPVKITNSTAFSGGEEKESNSTYLTKIKNSVHNKSLASPTAIKSKLQENYTTIVDVEVAGAGHPLMIRDLVSAVQDVQNYKLEDFYLAYSGQHTGKYDVKHTAFTGAFVDSDTSSDVSLPAITGWTQEFSNGMYEGVYLRDDQEYAEQAHHVLIREFFGDLEIAANIDPDLYLRTLPSGQWQLHDGVSADNKLFYTDEFGLAISQNDTVSRLRMGKTYDTTVTNATILTAFSEILNIQELLEIGTPDAVNSALTNVSDMVSAENFNNTAPIVHKALDQHTGITITTAMETTDGTEDGEMAYITVFRDSEIYLPHDGYGIAWRKQPEFLRRINLGGEISAEDEATFKEHYGSTLPDGYGDAGFIEANNIYWKYNVYLVDNDVLQEETWVGHDQIFDQTSGKNQFLAAGKNWIEPNIEYVFRIKIYQYMGTEVWVHPSSETGYEYTNAQRVISRGQTYPPYVVQAGASRTETEGGVTITSARNHFGIGIGQSRNYEWFVDDILIESFVETFAMHLFRFDITDSLVASFFPVGGSFTLDYYGVGYDPVQYVLAGNTGHSKVKAMVYNVATDAWELLGTHSYTIGASRALQKITKTLTPLSNYVDGQGFVNLGATAANSGPTFGDDTEHNLVSYYTSIANGSLDGTHLGNALDTYSHDPANTIEGSVTYTMTNPNTILTASIDGIAPYIQEIIEIREGISQTAFDPSTYTITNVDDGAAYSKNANYKIDFDLDDMEGTLIQLVYRYWTLGEAVDAFISSPDNSYPGADQLLKVMPPTVVKIDKLQYSSGLTIDLMKQKIIDYFNALTDLSFDKSDLVNVLYDNGATFVDLDMIINIREYSTITVKEETNFTGQTYTISSANISRFFTTLDELAGVEQI